MRHTHSFYVNRIRDVGRLSCDPHAFDVCAAAAVVGQVAADFFPKKEAISLAAVRAQ